MTMVKVVTLLSCLVAMVAAAPAAERTADLAEPAVSLKDDDDDGKALDRAKRSKEEIVFGNQQKSVRDPTTAAKKNAGQFPVYPPFVPRLPPGYGAGEGTPYDLFPAADDIQDKAGFMYASKQVPLDLEGNIEEETASEMQAAPTEEDSESKEGDEMGQQKETPDQQSAAGVQTNKEVAEPTSEAVMGQKELLEAEQAPESPELPGNEVEGPPPTEASHAVAESEVPVPQGPGLPEDSRRADAEEVLHAKNQELNEDDMELFLQDLKEASDSDEKLDVHENEEKDDEENEGAEKEEEGGSREEEELMQIAGQSPEGAGKMAEGESDEDFKKELLKYLLLNDEEFGGVPMSYADYPYPGSYFLQRRRRSTLAHHRRRLPLIRRQRRSSRRQLGRARRTKRDLYNDDLYYSPDAQYALQRAVEEEEVEEEKQAEIAELVSYLMALYPAVYDSRPQSSPYPGYLWYKSGSPEDAYQDYPQWEEEEEEPEYVDVPVGDWAPPSQPAPAWQPAFYPEEVVEEPAYYPSPLKRQVVPASKRRFSAYGPEGYSRWGVFVPSQEKRDYDDAYWRLRDLALALDEARQAPSSYVDALSDYRN